MARAYSLDLRERVVDSVEQGASCREACGPVRDQCGECGEVGAALLTGSAAAKKMGGHRPYLLEGQRDWLLSRVREKPDLTLQALLSELADRGIVVSCDTLWRFLVRAGISFKKNRLRQ